MESLSGLSSGNMLENRRISTQCPMENVTTTFQSLDTVRALHQTVVSLRSALEEAKFEIQRLRSQLSVQGDIKKASNERDNDKKEQQQKQQQQQQNISSTRTKSTTQEETIKSSQEKLHIEDIEDHQHHHHHHHYHHHQQQRHIHLEIPQIKTPLSPTCEPSSSSTTTTKHHHHQQQHQQQYHHKISSSSSSSARDHHRQKIVITPDITVVTHPNSSLSAEVTDANADADANTNDNESGDNNNKSKMGSKIDVKIKVMSNIKVDGSSSNNVDDQTEINADNENYNEKDNSISDIVTEGRLGFHLQTTTEDNFNIKKDSDGCYTITHSSKDNINLEDNENSQSEGDSSVFMEEDDEKPSAQTTTTTSTKTDQCSNEEKTIKKLSSNERKKSEQENKEEFDDIELIFSSDEQRDPIQEDLVSISEYYPWQQPGKSGTPVLVKFSSLPSDQNSTLKKNIRIGKLSTSTTYDVFLDSDTVSGTMAQQKSIESTDSLDMQTISFKSSSLEKDNSGEDTKDELRPLGRDESLDFFNSNDYSISNNRKWTNYNVVVETDISKCGIVEEATTFEMYRRNTCPNPPAYRSFALRESNYNSRQIPSRLTSKYSRRLQYGQQNLNSQGQISRPVYLGTKRCSPAQTNISALPALWKSESQLTGDRCHLGGPCTLPSKFVPTIRTGCPKHFSRISERTNQEARRILLSDINFTSMVPELSRSADHLCQDENNRPTDTGKQSPRYYKGNFLKTPDYAQKGITPSVSMTSPGVSQWTVNENSFGTQTIQTGESWCNKRGDSFDSCKSYSTGGGSRLSDLDRHHRSRSVPSIRCAICKQTHHGIRTSESMNYAPRVTFQEPGNRIRGSLPDLRYDCICSRRYCTTGRTIFPIHGDSSGSTESLLDEADTFVRRSMDSAILGDDMSTKRPNLRRMSENDIQRDYIPSKQSLPFLPKTAKCLKPGHLAKVISKNGRVVVGRVRYVGPLATNNNINNKKYEKNNILIDDLYVGVQLQSKYGDCDGTFEGRKIFECESQQGLFVPFKKVVMAWTS